jgi:hypothetical protein
VTLPPCVAGGRDSVTAGCGGLMRMDGRIGPWVKTGDDPAEQPGLAHRAKQGDPCPA